MKRFYLLIFAFVVGLTCASGQLPGTFTYDFTDGTIIANGQSTDGTLTLSGTYNHHSTNYGLDMKANSEINIAVTGSRTFRFLGSAYSSLNMVGTGSVAGDLGTQNSKVANDLIDTYDFVYGGGTATLNFKAQGGGSDIYLPSIEVIPAQPGSDTTSPVENIVYYFDLRDGSIIPNETSFNGNYTIEKGLFKVESGPSNAYKFNDPQHGAALKTGNKITLKVGGNAYIKIGGSIYSSGTITASSISGNFNVTSQASQTSGNYGNDGSTVDFLYAGTAGTVVLEFEGTNYIPYIEVVPVPYDVELEEWVKKAGTITVNGVEIGFTAADDASGNPTVTVSEGTVNSATPESASIRINLGGNPLDSFTPTFTGDIASVVVNQDSLKIGFSGEASNPKSYSILVTDNSAEAQAEAGRTYTYNFADGSEMPQNTVTKYQTFFTADALVSINNNAGDEFWYHDATHGVVIYNGNSFDIHVAGNATITFVTCKYSADNAIFRFTDESSAELGTIAAENNGGDDAFASSFTYTGPAGVITATLEAAGAVYMHGLTIENAAAIEDSNGKIDVWDFGAVQLDTAIYKNNLNEDIINSWYDASIIVGSSGNVLPSFTSGVLSWIGGSNDRLRTTNTNLTRYDENISGVTGYTGRVYVNSAAATGRYMSLTLSEDDEVTIIALSQNGDGQVNFQYVADPDAQTDVLSAGSEADSLKFVAKEDGTYHIFDTQGKPSYYRIYRKDASYVTLTGTVDESQANALPEGYGIVFTNEAGKSWVSVVESGNYSLTLPAGSTYKLSLADANGFIISNGNSLEVSESTTSYNITIQKVELYTVSGSIVGLTEGIENLQLVYTADTAANKIFMPEPVVNPDSATYSVELEPNCLYSISALGINDFYLPVDTILIGQADVFADLVFEAKEKYSVTINASGLSNDQLAKLALAFTNLNEEGYSYSFNTLDNISLRNGTYTIDYSGLDEFPVKMGLTSNLKVDGSAVTKTLLFEAITNWSFDDKVISSGDTAYNGLLFTGNIKNEIAKGHLSAGEGSTIQVPVHAGEKIRVSFYYSADFSIAGGSSLGTSSGSTSVIEYADYTYPGTEDGFVTLTMGAGTSYFTNISVGAAVDYQAEIYVGADKEYKTINEALAAISNMVRENDERVTILIDPGNYEEMLVINLPNVSIKNASLTPSIALQNKGVDIDANAVRITSYYGHGYNYYSMNNQKWDADVLRVNKENGYLSYENKGAGTTNGSYWNATVVVSANGFIAEDIIFENSFNQYISQKESEDVLVLWESGNKGVRPTDYGNIDVQDRSFVERAAAIATVGGDKIILNNCRVIGRQDSFYGGSGRVVVYKGAMMGAVDYLFGAMTTVFYKTDLVMNTSDSGSDKSYLTAAQQSSGRGYLMYECTVKSAEPGTETASAYPSKPGYFGRPWQATTSEVVFYNTTIEASTFPGSEGKSLIEPEGWTSSLGGESTKMYEFGTIENSGEDNQSSRAPWSTVLSEPTLTDGTAITTFNFTKGNDDWDPLPALIAQDPLGITASKLLSSVKVYAYGDRIYISNVNSSTLVNIYNLNGSLVKAFETDVNTNFNFDRGFWIVKVSSTDGYKAVKVCTN